MIQNDTLRDAFAQQKIDRIPKAPGDIQSENLSDYLSTRDVYNGSVKTRSLSKEAFLSWLDYNHPGLSDTYRQQLLTAFDNYSGMSFSPSTLQQIGEAMGDYSARGQFENDRFNNLNTAISEILNSVHTEEYTDPSVELARRKQAGINDDLNGGSQIGSGEPGDIALPENLKAPQNSGSSDVSAIAQAGFQFVSTAISLYSSIVGVQGSVLANTAKGLEIAGGLSDVAKNIISTGTAEFLSNGKYTDDDLADINPDGTFSTELLDFFKSRVDELPYSHRQKGQLVKIIDQMIFAKRGKDRVYTDTYETLVNTILKQKYDSRNDVAQSYAKPGASEEYTDGIKEMSSIYHTLNWLELDIAKNTALFQNRKLAKGLKIGLPEMEVNGDYATAKFKHEMGKNRNKIFKTFEDINKRINTADISPFWKLSLQGAVATLQGTMFSKFGL